mmetsp:Transcript_11773/g.29764  ORF Transcript_11773/g.29764 Transcript_11773/m.29764 type:complete len:221 (-) Transcript_11773:304-966(-)
MARWSPPIFEIKLSIPLSGAEIMSMLGLICTFGLSAPRHLTERYLLIAKISTKPLLKSKVKYDRYGCGGSFSPPPRWNIISVHIFASASRSSPDPAVSTAKPTIDAHGTLKYSIRVPVSPFVSTATMRFVVNITTSLLPLNAISQRSPPCRIGGDAWNTRSISSASSGRAFPRPIQLVLGSTWPVRRSTSLSGAASLPRSLFAIAVWTAKRSAWALRRSW